MNRLLQVLRYVGISVLGLLAVALTVAHWVEFRESDAELLATFSDQAIRPHVYRYHVGDRTIRYLEAAPAPIGAAPVILFVHGAPSSLTFFDAFFKDTTLLNHARLVAVDRPGYGYSDFGRVVTSIARQADLLQPLMERYRNAPFLVLVGSSYGGSLVARLAMNNPGLVSHVVFVSSALGPGLEYTYPISYYIDRPPLRWLIPRLLLNANDEKLAHRRALEEILPDWPRITAGVTLLHGKRDDLVYPSNVTFARQRLVNARVKEFILPESRHDIVVKKREYMTEIIRGVLKAYQTSAPGRILAHSYGTSSGK